LFLRSSVPSESSISIQDILFVYCRGISRSRDPYRFNSEFPCKIIADNKQSILCRLKKAAREILCAQSIVN